MTWCTPIGGAALLRGRTVPPDVQMVCRGSVWNGPFLKDLPSAVSVIAYPFLATVPAPHVTVVEDAARLAQALFPAPGLDGFPLRLQGKDSFRSTLADLADFAPHLTRKPLSMCRAGEQDQERRKELMHGITPSKQ